jgi:hypothetical protein
LAKSASNKKQYRKRKARLEAERRELTKLRRVVRRLEFNVRSEITVDFPSDNPPQPKPEPESNDVEHDCIYCHRISTGQSVSSSMVHTCRSR